VVLEAGDIGEAHIRSLSAVFLGERRERLEDSWGLRVRESGDGLSAAARVARSAS
jgi:hypothetical protein